jgi:RND family efflux transporter MFP subunit
MERTIQVWRIFWGIIFILLLAGGAWFFLHPPINPFIETVRPVRGLALQAVYATGTVEATVMMPIAARSAARLVEMNADEGSEVSKGQILARLEDENLQKTLEEVLARETFAEKNYTRKAALAKQGFETKAALDQAQADWGAARAAVARAAAEADFMKLTAPADGRIIKRDGEIGQMIAASQPVFWLSCCAPLRISAEVDEEDIAEVKTGQEVLIRADAFPDRVFHGAVQAITPKGDPIARSYRVRVKFTEDTPLQIGMTTETNIVISTHPDAMLLPNSAVTQNNKVFLLKNGVLAEQKVSVGARGPEQTEILSGMTMEDQAVLKPKPEMDTGQKVRAKLVPQAP